MYGAERVCVWCKVVERKREGGRESAREREGRKRRKKKACALLHGTQHAIAIAMALS